MKYLIVITILFSYGKGICQNIPPTPHQLTKLFKTSIDQRSRKSVEIGSSAWTICNQDSSFFKSDTLRIYDNLNYFYQINNCCNFIEWTFYRKNKFVQSDAQICKEPSSSSTKLNYFQTSVFSENGVTYLIVLVPGISAVKFSVTAINVVKLANNNISHEIVLKRVISHPFFIR